MLVKPAPNRAVPDPERGGLLPEEGRDVDATSTYWHRRVEDNDVVVVEADAAADESTALLPAPGTVPTAD